jgi:Tfp pilus assembly protein PilN
VTSHALTEPALQSVTRTLPRVNLLPPEVAELRRLRRTQQAVAVAGLLAVGAVAFLYLDARSGVHTAQQQLAFTQARTSSLQAELSRYASVDRVYAEVATMQSDFRTAMGPEIDWASYLNNLSLTVPGGVWLTQLTATETAAATAAGTPVAGAAPSVVPTGIGNIQFTGVAFGHDDVASWLASLAHQRGFTFPYLSSSTESGTGGLPLDTFSSSVVLTKAALSNRASLTGN